MNQAKDAPVRASMTQLEGQRVVSARLLHGDPALLLEAGTRATLVWVRSWREPGRHGGNPRYLHADGSQMAGYGSPPGPLRHEWDAYAHNDLGHFVRLSVTDEAIDPASLEFPHSE